MKLHPDEERSDFILRNDLTLSDFCNLELFTRDDGTVSPLFSNENGKKIGLIGYNASEGLSDFEIKEEAFQYFQLLKQEFFKLMGD